MKPGSIVLFHNAAVQTPASLPAIIEDFLAKRNKFVPIGELINKSNFHMTPDGTQGKD